MNYLVTGTPTGRLLDLPADDRDALMAREREVATALISGGVIVWMWRLPDTDTSVTVWDAESTEALTAHLESLPVFPYTDVEVTELAAHPAFPAPLHAAPRG
ncbi:muconolactone D-isomerase [Actinomycetospora succinea]|uniref:Muconolactone D-isomerase n=1 Tax=Actinomycetospora succinea TaxID=663603 RepID=A0A4R6VEH1_9PSEU|nr:muconolactone Delta-isomerase family protein [Actinomycetospora succinea]TDQ58850.1 muconolactone D-isomerase [Actinomycetospora succinea]